METQQQWASDQIEVDGHNFIVAVQNLLKKNIQNLGADDFDTTIWYLFVKQCYTCDSIFTLLSKLHHWDCYTLTRNVFENVVLIYFLIEFPSFFEKYCLGSQFSASMMYKALRGEDNKLIKQAPSDNTKKYFNFLEVEGNYFHVTYKIACEFVHNSYNSLCYFNGLYDDGEAQMEQFKRLIAMNVHFIYMSANAYAEKYNYTSLQADIEPLIKKLNVKYKIYPNNHN
jgi:hypothetical protein